MSPRGQVAVRPARPEEWLGVQSLLRELDELHAELVPEYFRPATRTESEWRRLLGDSTALVLVALDERAARAGRIPLLADLRHAGLIRRWCRGAAATSRR